jgi:hypothetical protein
VKTLPLRITRQPVRFTRAADPATDPKRSIGTLSGYAAVFNSDSEDLGGYIERIRPGAFRETLASADVVALINHDHTLVVGRCSAGTLRLREDDTGLAYEIDLPDIQAARDLVVSRERGDLKSCSFGFDWPDPTDMEWYERDGQDLCDLVRIKALHEISVGVTFPAYEATTMGLRDRYQAQAARAALSRHRRCRARVALERLVG